MPGTAEVDATGIGSLSRSSSSSRSAIFLPIPGNPRQGRHVTPRHCTSELRGGQRTEDGDGDLGPDVRDGHERTKGRALGLVGETEERERVLAHMRVHPKRDAAHVVCVRTPERS